MRLKNTAILVVATATLTGACATGGFVIMDVAAYPNPQQPIELVKTFQVVPIGKCNENELLEMNILDLVRQGLESKGLRHTDQTPDALLGVTCYVGERSQYVPPTTIYWPVPTTTTTTSSGSGSVGGVPYSGTGSSTSTQTRMVPLTRSGYTATDYFRRFSILAVRPTASAAEKAEPLWSGEVESYGSNSDFLIVAPYFINQLLGEFPRRSNLPTTRRVPMKSSPTIKR